MHFTQIRERKLLEATRLNKMWQQYYT